MLIAETILAPLRAVPIFQGLTEVQIAAIATVTERALYKPGDVIVEANASVDCAILIAWGEAVTLGADDTEPSLGVPAGSMLCEMAMFVEIEAGATIVARSAVRALRIRRDDMLVVLADDPDMADTLVQCVAGRLRNVVQVLDEIEGEFSRALDVAEIRHAVSVTLTGSGYGASPSPAH